MVGRQGGHRRCRVAILADRHDDGLFLLRLERVLHLLLDVAVVLPERPLFLLGQDSEWHADQTFRELHVEPMLAILDATRHVEIEAAKAGAGVADLDLVVRHRGRIQVGEEADAARPGAPWGK